MKWKKVINNNSYANNYDYHRAIYLLNKEVFFDNGFILLKESKKLDHLLEHYFMNTMINMRM